MFTMKLIIKESDSNIMLKMVNSDGAWYLIKSATRNKSFWNKSISYVNEFAKKETAIKKMYGVFKRLADNAFYDADSVMGYIDDEEDLKSAKFAEFYITDSHGNVIEDISDEVKEHLLNDRDFVVDALELYDDEFDESVDRESFNEDVDRSTAVKFSRDYKDLVKIGSKFLSRNGNGEDYEVVDIISGGRGSVYVTLKIIKDSVDAKYSSIGRKIYSVPISQLYNMLFIE
jgi:CRISPR/Cas system-associated protein Cas7 (RAMP superfamily)